MNNTPKQNEEKIKGINDSFLSALDDFKQYYVFYNKNPEVDEYSNNFENSKNQLQSLSGEMYTITNNIQKNIQTLNDDMIKLGYTDFNIQSNKNKYNEKKYLKYLNNDSIKLINQCYDKDFELFNYQKIYT